MYVSHTDPSATFGLWFPQKLGLRIPVIRGCHGTRPIEGVQGYFGLFALGGGHMGVTRGDAVDARASAREVAWASLPMVLFGSRVRGGLSPQRLVHWADGTVAARWEVSVNLWAFRLCQPSPAGKLVAPVVARYTSGSGRGSRRLSTRGSSNSLAGLNAVISRGGGYSNG